jgi:hypothetical protein
MTYRYARSPDPENYQDNRFHRFRWSQGGLFGPRFPKRGIARSAPAELPYIDFDPWRNTWHQAGIALPNFKPKKYWARPVDGKRRGAWGRLKDGLTGEGADVYVVLNADRRTLHRDMPHRAQWSVWSDPLYDHNFFPRMRHEDPDRTVSEERHFDVPWANQSRWYNFRSRKYEEPVRLMRNHYNGKLWTDAHWHDDAKRKDTKPLSYRDGGGQWRTQVPRTAGRYAGGRPRR